MLAVNVCGACHGTDGNGTNEIIPKLADQIPEYIVKQLNAFRPVDGKKPHRDNPTMTPIATSLSDGDIAGVAAYFAAQNPTSETSGRADLVATGETLYT